MTDYAYLQVAGYYIYDITPVDGGTRYTYCKTNPPPYGPNNPSFEICVDGKAQQGRSPDIYTA